MNAHVNRRSLKVAVVVLMTGYPAVVSPHPMRPETLTAAEPPASPLPGVPPESSSPNREIGGWEPSPAGNLAVVDLQQSTSRLGFVDLSKPAKINWVARMLAGPTLSWSPDGGRVVCGPVGWLTKEGYRQDRSVAICNALDGSVETLTSGHFDTWPSWSPDGKTIAFVRAVPEGWMRRSRIHLLRPDDTRPLVCEAVGETHDGIMYL